MECEWVSCLILNWLKQTNKKWKKVQYVSNLIEKCWLKWSIRGMNVTALIACFKFYSISFRFVLNQKQHKSFIIISKLRANMELGHFLLIVLFLQMNYVFSFGRRNEFLLNNGLNQCLLISYQPFIIPQYYPPNAPEPYHR